MIAEAGLAALWLAAAMALLQLAMAAIGLSARADDPPPIAAQLLAAVRPVAMVV